MNNYKRDNCLNESMENSKVKIPDFNRPTENEVFHGNPLKNLDNSFRRAKAEQIIRFLKDQEELSRRFTECKLNTDE